MATKKPIKTGMLYFWSTEQDAALAYLELIEEHDPGSKLYTSESECLERLAEDLDEEEVEESDGPFYLHALTLGDRPRKISVNKEWDVTVAKQPS